MLQVPLIPLVAVVVFSLFWLYSAVIYPIFISPLARVPNAHPLAPFTQAWILWIRWTSQENHAIYNAHRRYGSIVRLGPNEISVNCVDGGIRSVYSGGFEKHEFYSNLFKNYGVYNMFSMLASRPHASRKRLLTNVYSKSYLQSSSAMAAVARIVISDRLLPLMEKVVEDGGLAEVFHLFNCVTMDMVTAYKFGLKNGSNFTEDEPTAKWWLDLYQSRKKFIFWPQELPRFLSVMTRLGVSLVPSWVAQANNNIEAWTLSMCDAAKTSADSLDEEQNPEDIPVVHRQLDQCLSKLNTKDPNTQRLDVASELLDNLAAGHETSAITLTYLFHELCLSPSLQRALHHELTTALAPSLRNPKDSSAPRTLPSAKAIDALPLLHAITLETLRLHPAIPGSQPRLTPAAGCLLGGPPGSPTTHFIPPNVRVSASPYSLHRNADVYPDPLVFAPERWSAPGSAALSGREDGSWTKYIPKTEEDVRERARWFWPFSSGGRMCIGSNLAMLQMKVITAALVGNYGVGIEDDEGIEQQDGYTAHPKGGKLVLKFARV